MPAPAVNPFVFYGYPAELVAGWCAVSLNTAKLYKAGKRKPSVQALRLFTLHRDNLILNSEWRGWKVVDGSLIDPSGNSFTQSTLLGYRMILQWVSAVAARQPDTKLAYYELLKRA